MKSGFVLELVGAGPLAFRRSMAAVLRFGIYAPGEWADAGGGKANAFGRGIPPCSRTAGGSLQPPTTLLRCGASHGDPARRVLGNRLPLTISAAGVRPDEKRKPVRVGQGHVHSSPYWLGKCDSISMLSCKTRPIPIMSARIAR
jgi:hypothetical protein